MKTLVTYFTQTGNTEKIAQAIYCSVPGQKELKKLSEAGDADTFDLVFVGFPIYNFEPPRAVKEFIEHRLKNKNIVLFITMSLTSVPKDDRTATLYNMTINNCRSCAQNSNIIDVFDCPGELSEKTAEALIKSDNPQFRAFGMLRNLTIGFPKEENVLEAKAFTERVFKDFSESGQLLRIEEQMLN